MSRPLVLLLADDVRTATATVILLQDWGYEAISSASTSRLVNGIGPGRTVTAIIVDLIVAPTWRAVGLVLTLRTMIGAEIPSLIQAAEGLPARPWLIADRVTILPKPIDPLRIRAWLDSLEHS